MNNQLIEVTIKPPPFYITQRPHLCLFPIPQSLGVHLSV